MTTPAGWYPDPSNAAQQRYWDGNGWTEHVHPPVAAQPDENAAALSYASETAQYASETAQQGTGAVDATTWADTSATGVAGQYGSGHEAASAAAGGGTDPWAGAGAQQNAGGQGGDWGVGGIHTELLSPRYAEVSSGERVALQNSKLLKVLLGNDVLARQGSMVAFQGAIDFDHEGAGAARFLKKALTGEGLPLMRCHGQGELFLAEGAKYVHIIYLDNAGLSVNGRNVLAFEPSLSWDIARVQGASVVAGGLFNTRMQGSGWVAVTTKGEPVVLRTDQPTFVDTDAVVAWSAGLTTSLRRSVKMKALIGKGSGEAVQLAFQGNGIVIVQPSEGDGPPTAQS